MTSSFSPSGNKIKLTKNFNNTLQSSLNLNDNKNLFYLPPVDIKTKRKAFIKPTSILTRFVQERTKSIIKSTKEELRRPIKINMFTSPNLAKSQKRNKSINKKYLSHKVFITDSNINNNKDTESLSKNNDSSINKLIDLNLSKSTNKYGSKKEITLNNIDGLSSLTIDHGVKESHLNALMNKFRRIRSYQPVISENWKFKNGLRVTIGKQKTNALPIKDDVEYQYKLINDEYKLLEDNYTYYKSTVIINEDFYRSFKAMPLMSKITYNKMLEESIGILYILPQMLLAEFYNLIKNYSNVSIPKEDLFKDKYVFDEVQNLSYNNNLLAKVFEFFKACYEVYGTLIREVNDMSLNLNSFNNIINCLEKARFNLSYLATSSKNALKNYNNDLQYIRKMSNENKLFEAIDVTEKMRSQFAFKKNDEKQRKLRIEAALENKYDRDNYFEEKKKRDNSEDKKFVSFLDSKLIDRLMKHFTKKVRNEITTQKINKEIDGRYTDDDYTMEKHKVVKINI
jgi:hypothetical protein